MYNRFRDADIAGCDAFVETSNARRSIYFRHTFSNCHSIFRIVIELQARLHKPYWIGGGWCGKTSARCTQNVHNWWIGWKISANELMAGIESDERNRIPLQWSTNECHWLTVIYSATFWLVSKHKSKLHVTVPHQQCLDLILWTKLESLPFQLYIWRRKYSND